MQPQLRRKHMKNLTVHSFSVTLAGLVLAGYWAFYLVTVVAPRIG
jgi:hypothetical protein